MSTATEVTVKLTPETGKLLAERASRQGQDVPTYLSTLIDQELKRTSIDEILAPFRAEVKQSGMNDNELDGFFEEVRDEVWQDRQAKRAS